MEFVAAVLQDVPDTLTDLYTNNSGKSAALKSVSFSHQDSPERYLLETTGAVDCAIKGTFSQQGHPYSSVRAIALTDDKLLVIGGSPFNGSLATFDMFAQVVIREGTGSSTKYKAGPIRWFECTDTLSHKHRYLASLVKLSSTKVLVTAPGGTDHTIYSLSVSGNTVDIIGTATVANNPCVCPVSATKAVVFYDNAGNIEMRGLSVPDNSPPSLVGSSSTVVTGATYPRAVKANSLADEFAVIGYSSGTVNKFSSVTWTDASNTSSVNSTGTINTSNTGSDSHCVLSFSDPTTGGFHATYITVDHANPYYLKASTQTTKTSSSVASSQLTMPSNYGIYLHVTQISPTLAIVSSLLGAGAGASSWMVAKNGTTVDLANFAVNANGTSVFPFKDAPVIAFEGYGYATRYSAMTSNSIGSSDSPYILIPYGLPDGRKVRWNEVYQCYHIAVGGCLFHVDSSGSVLGCERVSYFIQSIDVSSTGLVAVCENQYGTSITSTSSERGWLYIGTPKLTANGTSFVATATLDPYTSWSPNQNNKPLDVMFISATKVLMVGCAYDSTSYSYGGLHIYTLDVTGAYTRCQGNNDGLMSSSSGFGTSWMMTSIGTMMFKTGADTVRIMVTGRYYSGNIYPAVGYADYRISTNGFSTQLTPYIYANGWDNAVTLPLSKYSFSFAKSKNIRAWCSHFYGYLCASRGDSVISNLVSLGSSYTRMDCDATDEALAVVAITGSNIQRNFYTTGGIDLKSTDTSANFSTKKWCFASISGTVKVGLLDPSANKLLTYAGSSDTTVQVQLVANGQTVNIPKSQTLTKGAVIENTTLIPVPVGGKIRVKAGKAWQASVLANILEQ